MALNVKPKTLGMRIATLRKKQEMGLEQLANETGYEIDYLEEIESDTIIPPVAVLLKLSRALDVDSAEFFKKDPEVLDRRADALRRRTDRYAYQVLTPDGIHKHLKSFLVTIDPASDLQGASYQHEGEEFIYVLKGDVHVTVGQNEHHLKGGNHLHFNSGLPHKLSNTSDVECELLVVLYTP